ncbi:2-polyprenyl-6-methoxyphenol hydroxylase [Noviherbaspirillum suwonense]|uniref:2-polyprenyl-6-methoxyphenol hydroxylase n=2 Tax=Noviherbaspirillum suwonense TaxID=1224511 RepID=A0ABY1Q0Z2_9BURK|nr:2-polyprenyl-6-methoxyphenol hydroxylase [Noviherbaspirillum suwonense]
MQGFDVCVIGGGPSGCITALSLAIRGVHVCVIEKYVPSDARSFESLTDGIWPVLDAIGIRESFLKAALLNFSPKIVLWENAAEPDVNFFNNDVSMIVDRSRFNEFFLKSLQDFGVAVFRPAIVTRTKYSTLGWEVDLSVYGKSSRISSRFVVDACGKSGFLPQKKTRNSPRTIALCGTLQNSDSSPMTYVEAFPQAWCWGSSLPNKGLTVMMFSDSDTFNLSSKREIEEKWRSALSQSKFFSKFSSCPLSQNLILRNATAYCVADPLQDSYIKVGDASFSLDPLSSSGVEKAMHTGLTASAVIRTILNKPARLDLCKKFYCDYQSETIAMHIFWATSSYAKVKRFDESPFWKSRSVSHIRAIAPRQNDIEFGKVCDIKNDTFFQFSKNTKFEKRPCIIDSMVCENTVLVHPNLARPIAFVSGVDVDRLFPRFTDRINAIGLLRYWAENFPSVNGVRTAAWLLTNQVMEVS